jgi:DNA (cytosine-5)-methyltransferase 1
MAFQQSTNEQFRELALFAGAGGGILGSNLLGWRTVCAVERDAYASQVLAQRQNDGCLEPFPIWSDVCSFDGRPWKGRIDVVSGGFPCQDISSAGKGAGISGERSGLWKQMARIIGEVEPPYAFIENSPMLRTRGLSTILEDLAEMGFDAEWGCIGASSVGAPHKRERLWIVAAHPNREYRRAKPQQQGGNGERAWGESARGCWWYTEPNVGRLANGVAHRVERHRALGNGQVPAVAAAAWDMLISQRSF